MGARLPRTVSAATTSALTRHAICKSRLALSTNAVLLVWRWLDNRSVRHGHKIVFSGVVTQIVEGCRDDDTPRRTIYLAGERFDIPACESPADLAVGQVVSLHYVQKKNLQPGRLLRVMSNVE